MAGHGFQLFSKIVISIIGVPSAESCAKVASANGLIGGFDGG